MTNYGPPLRFKAVDIETGKDVGTNKLIIDPSDGQWHACYGGDTIRYDEEWVTEVHLYQSTGHTDAKGVEVFFGDVCLIIREYSNRTDVMGCVVLDSAILFKRFDLDTGEHWALSEEVNHSKVYVLGNIHTPQAELERRAKEVRGDE